ncbi:hypothetical protein JCM8547_008603 [Rhodosporidiobolus lusitaniae]
MASSSPVDSFKAPLLPVVSYERKDSIASSGTPPQSSLHRRTSSNSSFSRLPPRRLVSIPLVLASLALLAYTLHSRSASSSSLDYTTRRAAGLIWADRGSSTLAPIKDRISAHIAAASCQEGAAKAAGQVVLSAEELKEKFDRATRPMPVDATTEDRLDEWEFEAPGWGVEPADWVRRNMETCPSYRIRPNENTQQLGNSHLVWSSMNTTAIMGYRNEMISYLRKRGQEGAMGPKAWGKGKGLVFTAGNADTFSRVLLTLKMLRNHLHTNLPSEIYSFPGEEPDEQTRKDLESYGATLKVVETAYRDGSRTKNYHIKASAIIRSSFREVLFLDSDNIPAASLMPADPSHVPAEVYEQAQNKTDPWTTVKEDGTTEEVWGKPSGIWEAMAYKRLGVMFWPDYWRTQTDNPIWALIGTPCRDEWEQEAGQILIDKSKHLDALLLAEWMMDSSRFKFWFNFSDGDKDMFRFAMLALRKRWAIPGRYVSVGALPRNTMSGFCGLNMLQHDHLGRPLMVHANLLKQVPSGVGKGFAWGRHRQIRTPPSSLSLQDVTTTTSMELEAEDPMMDDDLDCDHLANAGNDGFALKQVPDGPVGWRIRRRAVMEKGIRAGFHGGWVSALCIDYHYDDPRSDDDKWTAKLSVAAVSPNPDNKSLQELAEQTDICYTAAPDSWETKWCNGDDVTEIVQWKDDPRLRGFEEAFFREGGKLNGKGF